MRRREREPDRIIQRCRIRHRSPWGNENSTAEGGCPRARSKKEKVLAAIVYSSRMQADEKSNMLAVAVSESDHALGPASAPVTLVEYGDYECPDCLNAFPIVKQLQERFGDRLRFVFRHFPRNSLHPHAGVAAQAAEAAALQGKFWQMHETLFQNQQRLGDVDFANLALKIGAELYNFEANITSDRVVRRVETDRTSGEASNVRGTPTFFINGEKYRGRVDAASLSDAIERAMQ
jgi:protein-disulfide isomerase